MQELEAAGTCTKPQMLHCVAQNIWLQTVAGYDPVPEADEQTYRKAADFVTRSFFLHQSRVPGLATFCSFRVAFWTDVGAILSSAERLGVKVASLPQSYPASGTPAGSRSHAVTADLFP
eukprot:scaffold70235_cov37-Prasinocladus_malaysianus.AAC.1